jgi:hypothetical protein
MQPRADAIYSDLILRVARGLAHTEEGSMAKAKKKVAKKPAKKAAKKTAKKKTVKKAKKAKK